MWTITRRRLVIFLLVSSLLLPGIQVFGYLEIRVEELIVLMLMPVLLTRLRGRWSWIDVCFGLMGVSTIISMAWGLLGKNIPFEPRDLMELVKLVKYWVFFRLAIHPWTEQDMRSITYSVLVSMGIAAFIGLVQWFDWMGIGRLTWVVYSNSLESSSVGRIIGTAANPNDFAMLMITGLAFIASTFPWYQHRLFLVMLGGLDLWTIVLTRSRTGIMGAGMALFIVMLLRVMWLWRISVRQWFRWVTVALAVIMIVGLPTGKWLVSEFRSIGEMNSAELLEYVGQGPVQYLLFRLSVSTTNTGIGGRTQIWEEQWRIFQESPWFGWGPGKSSFTTIVDNEYLLYLRRYGIVGLVFYLLLLGQVLRTGWKLLHLSPYYSAAWAIGLSIVTIVLVYLAASMLVGVYYKLQLMSLFWLIVGVGYSLLHFPTNTQGGKYDI